MKIIISVNLKVNRKPCFQQNANKKCFRDIQIQKSLTINDFARTHQSRTQQQHFPNKDPNPMVRTTPHVLLSCTAHHSPLLHWSTIGLPWSYSPTNQHDDDEPFVLENRNNIIIVLGVRTTFPGCILLVATAARWDYYAFAFLSMCAIAAAAAVAIGIRLSVPNVQRRLGRKAFPFRAT